MCRRSSRYSKRCHARGEDVSKVTRDDVPLRYRRVVVEGEHLYTMKEMHLAAVGPPAAPQRTEMTTLRGD
jgi:hypothetical protein